MKLEFESIEDSMDDTTHLRTLTEQACIKDKGWLIRTTVYSPHSVSINVTFIPGDGKKCFDAIAP